MPSPTSTNIILEAGHALSRPYELICRGGWGHDPALKMNFQERVMPYPSPGFAKPVGTGPVWPDTGQTGLARFRFGPVPNRLKFKIQIWIQKNEKFTKNS